MGSCRTIASSILGRKSDSDWTEARGWNPPLPNRIYARHILARCTSFVDLQLKAGGK
jgi:hypothetical protein